MTKETEVLGEEPVPVLLYAPQNPHGLAWDCGKRLDSNLSVRFLATLLTTSYHYTRTLNYKQHIWASELAVLKYHCFYDSLY
jgi:hypothetical protein